MSPPAVLFIMVTCSFGGNGRYAGRLHWINAIGQDSKLNIYRGEVEHAKRIQKFVSVVVGGR
jgi:hypothetical protein